VAHVQRAYRCEGNRLAPKLRQGRGRWQQDIHNHGCRPPTTQEIDGAAVIRPIDDIPATPKVLIPGHVQTPCQLTQTAPQLRSRRLGGKGTNRRQARVHQAVLCHGGEPITGRRNASLRIIGWPDAHRTPLALVEALGKER
jgi:hypothetical protein